MPLLYGEIYIIVIIGINAMDEKLEILRNKLNEMIVSEYVDKDELLKLSQELDILIVEYLLKNSR